MLFGCERCAAEARELYVQMQVTEVQVEAIQPLGARGVVGVVVVVVKLMPFA